jgi:enterochelin esterase-like enzyme
MFSSSVTTGDWETFIASDLVKYVDTHFRTLASRDSRGLSGFSMGGYGTLRIAMKRPEVFSSIYAMSSCCLQPPLPPLTQPEAFAGFAGLEQIKTPEAAAWSPNPANPPLFLDLPTLEGKPQPNVVAAWSANTPLAMIHQYIPALKRLTSMAFDVGKQDGLLADNERLHAILEGYGIAHHFESFEGGHGDMVPVRFEMQVLPFFSRHLASR